jgi:retinol dehydrogenase 12
METHTGRSILITGGTSGLGLELVKLFHKKGFYVICTGRQPQDFSGFTDNFRFFRTDFSNLTETVRVFKIICSEVIPDFVINNAGILSPSGFNVTDDGFEFTFQVNFLAHLIVNEIIIRNNPDNHHIKIGAVTSPVFKMKNIFPDWRCNISSYKPLKAYSDSKLFLALMCEYLDEKYTNMNATMFSIDPGVFSSSIYRTQGKIFRLLYGVAAPFMRNPAKVAESIFEMMVNQGFSDGRIFTIRKKSEPIPVYDQHLIDAFWIGMNEITEKYLKS